MSLVIDESFLSGAVVKNPPGNHGNTGSIPGSRRSPGIGNGNPFQYSCLGNPTEEPEASDHEVTKSQTRLSD